MSGNFKGGRGGTKIKKEGVIYSIKRGQCSRDLKEKLEIRPCHVLRGLEKARIGGERDRS